VRDVPWWGVLSSVAAPVLLVSGWTVAASLQPRFDPVADTVSALAAQGATDRWVMTVTFLVVGVSYVVTALSLRPARAAGRLILLAGALVGMLVAANPEHPGDAYPIGHIIAAPGPPEPGAAGPRCPGACGPRWPRPPSRCCLPWYSGSAPS